MKRTVIFSLTAFLFLLTFNAQGKKVTRSESDKKVITAYKEACFKKVNLALDKQQSLCNCQIVGNLKHMKISEMALLIPEQIMSDKEASKIKNENSKLDTLSEVEYNVHIKCEKEILGKRIH